MTLTAPNVTGMESLFVWMNNLTNGVFGPLILLSVFMISFLRLYYSSTENALLASLFITSVVGILLSIMGLVNTTLVASIILITGATILIKIL